VQHTKKSDQRDHEHVPSVPGKCHKTELRSRRARNAAAATTKIMPIAAAVQRTTRGQFMTALGVFQRKPYNSKKFIAGANSQGADSGHGIGGRESSNGRSTSRVCFNCESNM
jgi:hypothetical protein